MDRSAGGDQQRLIKFDRSATQQPNGSTPECVSDGQTLEQNLTRITVNQEAQNGVPPAVSWSTIRNKWVKKGPRGQTNNPGRKQTTKGITRLVASD